MVKPMRYAALTSLLKDAGFTSRPGKGDHEVWANGRHQITITKTRDVSPGLVRKALNTIEAAKES